MDRFLLIFLIIIAIIELATIIYYKNAYKIAKDYCDKCKDAVNELLNFIDNSLSDFDIVLNQQIKEKGENKNESN